MSVLPIGFGSSSGYNIDNSVRLRASASAYLSRTPAGGGNQTVWTLSVWVKRSTLGANQYIFSAGLNGSNTSDIFFDTSDKLNVSNYVSSVYKTNKVSNAVFRDSSAWLHLCISSNGASSLNVSINNQQLTWGTSVGPDATNWYFNSTNLHTFSRYNAAAAYYLDGHLSDVYFIDGQALTPSSFGETNADGVWVPKPYTGTYGTNGFHLDFKDASGLQTLGYDVAKPSGSSAPTIETGINTNGTGWQSYGLRQIIEPAAISYAGTQVRLTFQAGTQGCVLNGVKIGKKASSGNAWDFDGNQVQVTFSSSSSVTMGASAAATSDWITFSIDPTATYVVAMAIATGGPHGLWYNPSSPGASGLTVYENNTGTANATDTAPTGYGVLGSGNAALLSKVEVEGNHWACNSISVTAGVTYDSMVDTPMNNFCTLNPLDVEKPTNTFSAANLRAVTSASTVSVVTSTFSIPRSGKWYWEVTVDSVVGVMALGVCKSPIGTITTNGIYQSANGWSYMSSSGNKANNDTGSTYGATYTTGNVISVAFDADVGSIYFAKAGLWADGTGNCDEVFASAVAAYSSLAVGDYFPMMGDASGANTVSADFNFGQRPFAYTPPTGFKPLCTANLPAVAIPNPKKHFDIVTRAGTAASYSVSGLQFQPDMAWIKSRGRSVDHAIYDAVRGVEKRLESNNSDAEVTGDTTGLTAFNSTGYSGGALDQINGTTATNAFVDWLWKAGGAPSTDNVAGAGNTPTAGSVKIDGTNLGSALAGTIAAIRLSANTTAGFSIVTYTGNGGTSSSTTVAHGLGKTPAMVIHKSREAGGNDWWNTWHTSLGGNYGIWLESTAARNLGMWTGYSNFTTAVFTPPDQTYGNVNTVDYVAYCFAEIPGYSKFGSYTATGSGADQNFVYCGFKPKWIMFKVVTAADQWAIVDVARSTYNPILLQLYANTSAGDVTMASGALDILSNGFKIRTPADSVGSAQTIIFAAFAELPFGGGNVAPAPAR